MHRHKTEPTGRTEMVGNAGRIVVRDEDVHAYENRGYVVIEPTDLEVTPGTELTPEEAPPAAPEEKAPSAREELEAKTVPELREIAKKHGLSGDGKKAEIIDALLEAAGYEQPAEGGEDAGDPADDRQADAEAGDTDDGASE